MIKWFLGAVVVYATLVLLLAQFQERLLFFPDRTPMDECEGVFEDKGAVFESRSARYYQVDHPDHVDWIIYFHGNGGRACDRYSFLRQFRFLGYNLMLAEYPGYAESKILPTEAEVLASALDAMDALLEQSLPEAKIIIYGESLGTTVATYVAAHRKASGLILQAPFPSVAKVGQSRYFIFPVEWMARYRFPAEQWARQVSLPLFAYHGTADWVIPLEFGRGQIKNFASKELTFWEVPGAGHINVVQIGGDELLEKVAIFLEAL